MRGWYSTRSVVGYEYEFVGRCERVLYSLNVGKPQSRGRDYHVVDVVLHLGMSKGGTEIAAKAISTHLELNPTWAAFKNDFSNAFNACARRRMVEQLLKSPFAHFEPAFRLFY